MIDVPARIVWDYAEPPAEEKWRLQRVLDFFPQFGRDRKTVEHLVARLDELRAPPEVKDLVRLYAEHYGIVGRAR